MLALRRHLVGLGNHCRYLRNTKSVSYSTSKNADLSRIIVEPLKNRELICVRGEEANSFLQGLITNDIKQLEEQTNFSAIYTLFLNRGGRVLYDAIIYHVPNENTYYIECDSQISSELRRYLRQYRVRRKIDIDEVDTHDLWVAFSPHKNINIKTLSDGMECVADPRVGNLGTRLFIPKKETWEQLTKVFSKSQIGIAEPPGDECNYKLQRYKHGIAEGVEELPPSKCFPFESNADYLNGISFQKGCYVGQELTARTYHTGVVRKRVLPLRFSWPETKIGEEISTEGGRKVGMVRGCYNTYGLGVLYVEKALGASGLIIDGEPCRVITPNWWPKPSKDKEMIADA